MVVEVILQSKVPGLGVEADVVKVKPGYARNYLFPQGLAFAATSASKKQIEVLKRKRAEREAQELNEAQELAAKLGKVKLSFTLVMGGGQGKAFGAITAQDIADKLKEAGFEMDRRKIELARPIKDAGDHEIVIQVHSEVQAKVNVAVTAVVEKKEVVRGGKEHKAGGKFEKRFKSKEVEPVAVVEEAEEVVEKPEKPEKSKSRRKDKDRGKAARDEE